MTDLCCKSRILTGYLELLIEENLSSEETGLSSEGEPKTKKRKMKGKHLLIRYQCHYWSHVGHVTIVTSKDLRERGCQLSIQFSDLPTIRDYICERGAVVSMS